MTWYQCISYERTKMEKRTGVMDSSRDRDTRLVVPEVDPSPWNWTKPGWLVVIWLLIQSWYWDTRA